MTLASGRRTELSPLLGGHRRPLGQPRAVGGEGWGDGPADALSLALVLAMMTWPPERPRMQGRPIS